MLPTLEVWDVPGKELIRPGEAEPAVDLEDRGQLVQAQVDQRHPNINLNILYVQEVVTHFVTTYYIKWVTTSWRDSIWMYILFIICNISYE